MANPAKRVRHDLDSGLALRGVIEMQPATTAAATEVRALDLAARGTGLDQLDDLGTQIAWLCMGHPRADAIARSAGRHKDHQSVMTRDAVPTRRKRVNR